MRRLRNNSSVILASGMLLGTVLLVSNSIGAEYVADATITLSPPLEGVYHPGMKVDITWATSGAGITNVNLYYNTEHGPAYIPIAEDAPNTGDFTWTIPVLDTHEIDVKIDGTDGTAVLATDFSDLYITLDPSIVASPDDVTTPAPADESPSTDSLGEGIYLQAAGLPTIYYLDHDATRGLVRRPFPNEAIYRTYQSSFDVVQILPLSVVSQYPIGAPMLPKPGSSLVSVESDPKVYVVTQACDGKVHLRWIVTEEVAKLLFGDTWAKHVITLPPTLWKYFLVDTPILSSGDFVEQVVSHVLQYAGFEDPCF